jgi:hypothetical protein
MAKNNGKRKINYDREKAKVWGSPDYLKMHFFDIHDVSEASRRCVDTVRSKNLVRTIATRNDEMRVHKVYHADLVTPEGQPGGRATIVNIALGLNGPGDQSDYFAALKRLVDTRAFHIFDCLIDSLDDVMSVLCTYSPAEAKKVFYAPKKGKEA